MNSVVSKKYLLHKYAVLRADSTNFRLNNLLQADKIDEKV